MSATLVGDMRQTVLPADVSEAAGLKPGDRVDWRFEDGEIRGRKLSAKPEPPIVMAKLIEVDGALVCDTSGFTMDPEAIAKAVREERDSR